MHEIFFLLPSALEFCRLPLCKGCKYQKNNAHLGSAHVFLIYHDELDRSRFLVMLAGSFWMQKLRVCLPICAHSSRNCRYVLHKPLLHHDLNLIVFSLFDLLDYNLVIGVKMPCCLKGVAHLFHQDEEGKPILATADDYACLRFQLVPRLVSGQPGPGPSWAAAPDGIVSAHATLVTRGQARIENRMIFSGSEGAVIVSTSKGGLSVTDASGAVWVFAHLA